jgi:hypothetical protein
MPADLLNTAPRERDAMPLTWLQVRPATQGYGGGGVRHEMEVWGGGETERCGHCKKTKNETRN